MRVNAFMSAVTKSHAKGLIISIVLSCILMILALEKAHAQQQDFSMVDRYIEEEMKSAHIPGLALTIVQDDRIIYQRGYGVSGPDNRSVTPQTPFFTASAGSKSITALAIMQLVEEGKIELESPVQEYLLWFTLADPVSASQITARHLLNHTSGFSAMDGRRFSPDHINFSIEQEVRSYDTLKLDRPVGESFEYSNINYNILGMLVETAAGQSYADYVRRHIFSSLDMRNSFTSVDEAQRNGLVVGYRQWFGVPVAAADIPVWKGALPSAYVISSTEDLGHLLIAHLNDGKYLDSSVVSPAAMAELHRPAVEAHHYNMDGKYAMGCHVIELNGTTAIWFPGDLANMQTSMVIVPEKQLGVSVQMNVNGGLVNDRLASIAPNVMRLLLSYSIMPPPGNSMVGRLLVVALVLLLQVIGFVRSIIKLKRWYHHPELHPQTVAGRISAIGLPLAIDLVLSGGVLVGLPCLFHVPFSTIRLFWPDMGALLCSVVIISMGWGLLRSILGIWVLNSAGRISAQIPTT